MNKILKKYLKKGYDSLLNHYTKNDLIKFEQNFSKLLATF